MAQLEVQPKKKANLWWLWILLGLIAIALFYFITRRSDNRSSEATATTDTSNSATGAPAPTTSIESAAATHPDWSGVDFNSPETSDPDITDRDISVRGNNSYTIYSLGENILFATGQSTLQGTADRKLKQVASSLNRRFKGSTVGVFGNTDSAGGAGDNKQLGAERAAAVKDWLIKNGGLDESKVSVQSFGESRPVASNATAGGRQQNRNVENVVFANNTANQ